ncbi:MAG: response regulator transcription factor [Saprospiraceae bacterium]|nr:response regulator transcription factor [Saprospiraceae bacterium]MCF8249382.1 response regulator transcription factor [Saprospiraceae bacterium]MCF8279036.1 response regulator transcription factor [Bacteroidales bacterium]MCF8311511.1 response regulator transcription factor [Saprospiraceae bacterium]MCF8440001.1 response regulator transcription factor [Saprospiraceae bacterium]
MKVLIVEDEVKTVQSLKKGLEEHQMVVEFAHDGLSGKQIAEAGNFDVIISDVVMPKMSGFELVKHLRDAGVRTPILLLTAMGATDDKVIGFEAGADDYLVKPFEFKELLVRIRALARRGKEGILPKTILSFSDLEMNLDAKTCHRGGKKVDLTPKEFALMEYLIRNQGRVVSKVEIAEKVWDINFDTGTNVIEVYVSYLRNKLDRPFDKKLIHTIFGLGYVLKEEE